MPKFSLASKILAASLLLGSVAPAFAADDPIATYGPQIQASVTTSATSSAGYGFATMAVVLGLTVGMSLLRSFVSRGAKG